MRVLLLAALIASAVAAPSALAAPFQCQVRKLCVHLLIYYIFIRSQCAYGRHWKLFARLKNLLLIIWNYQIINTTVIIL